MVFAVPGGPSSNICPPAKSAISIRSIVSACPVIALPISFLIRTAAAFTSSMFTDPPRDPVVQLLCCFLHVVFTRCGSCVAQPPGESSGLALVAAIEPLIERLPLEILGCAEQRCRTAAHQR